jgi:hypothetical protein
LGSRHRRGGQVQSSGRHLYLLDVSAGSFFGLQEEMISRSVRNDGKALSMIKKMITFETSWLDEEGRGFLRALLTQRFFVRDPDLFGAWGAGGSVIDFSLGAGAGEAVWLWVVDLSELPELESP